MYLAFGLAVVRYPIFRESYRQNILLNLGLEQISNQDSLYPQRLQLLDRFGLTMTSFENSKVDLHRDLGAFPDLTIMPMGDNQEAWFGLSVGSAQNLFLSNWDLKLPTFDGTFFYLDFEQRAFSYQYIEGGKLGPAGSITDKKSWSRVFKLESLPIPQFFASKRAIVTLAKNLQADPDLVRRVLDGLKGKGFYGMAYHGEKDQWVIAKSLAEDQYDLPVQFQELNPRSYKKKGKPIDVRVHAASGLSFLSQSALFEMYIQDMIFQIFDFKVNFVDGISYDEQFADRKCFRGRTEKISRESVTPH